MNFDEIKEKMNAESMDNSQIPKNISVLKASEMPVEKVRKTMLGEIIMQLAGIVFIFAIPSFIPLYPLAESFYYIIMFATCLMTVGYVAKMMWFLNKTKGMNTGSRDTVINYIHDLQITLEVYKTAIIAGSLLLPLSMLSLITGIKVFDESLFNNFLLLNISTFTLIISILIYLILAFLIYLLTVFWADKLYGIHIKKLQEILTEFEI